MDNEFGSDLTALPGWQTASSETRAAATAAAERYLREARPNPEQWIEWNGPITIYRPDWAGFRAFRLLLAKAPDTLARLPTEVWVRWAPVLVAFPMFDNSGGDGWCQDLIYRAYRQAPDQVLATLRSRIQVENEGEHPSVDRLLRMMAQCWDGRLARAIVELVEEPGLASVITGQLLRALFDHGIEETVPLALSMVPMPLPTEEQERDRAVVVTAMLLKHAPDAGWSTVWPTMQLDLEFADSVLGRLVWDERRTPAAAERLSERAVADLYIWLCRRYPPEKDPEINGIVEYRAAVGQWRDGLLTHMRLQGTEEACQAIAKAMAALPEQEWLKWTFLEARSLTRQRTWVPPRPPEIRDLVASADRRLIQNADQLTDAVVESLTRLEANLQLREPPAAIDLWDEVAKNTFKPKDEERLSDYLKRHLDNELGNRGIVFNREVTNRPGEETDIRVEAMLRGQDGTVIDLLTVIIEVKGCWHPELWTAMETQLVNRYLGETRTDHGLYVAGWYNCEKWTRDDYRKSRAPRLDKEEAQRRLRTQAEDLSRGGKRISAVVIDTSLR